ncbi:TPA: acyltransferase family protein [Serratia marcescens]|uniref:acyltransferase family protein n=1 Tax=Serratia marcescens TaxID=615 RepID=UPI0013A530A7|nr:acyltransferase [Serratia marcescens]
MESNKRNLSLDFFRGVMAIIVAIGHLFYWNENYNFPHSFILAVDFFLVLSGFVLTKSVLSSDNFCSITFAKKRYFRLAPVYLFCAVLTGASAIFIKGTPIPTLSESIKIIGIAQIWPFDSTEGFAYIGSLAISWTISAELWLGIIMFPIVYFLHKSARPLFLPFILIVAIFSFLAINKTSPNFMDIQYNNYNEFILFGMIRAALDYSLGILAFALLGKVKLLNMERANSLLQLSTIAACLFLYSNIDYNRENEIFAPFIFMVLVCSLGTEKGLMYKLLSGKVSEFLGDISYPSYMIHILLLYVMTRTLSMKLDWLTISIFVITLLIASKAINIMIEKPFMKILKG